MKTAISVPDGDFERFERVAAQHGLNRSESYRVAGKRFADELEGGSELTRIADAVLRDARESDNDSEELFVRESERRFVECSEW